MTRASTQSVLVAGLVLSSLVAFRARAEDGRPLLVVVEASPDLAVDASEIRRAIGTELHGATVAPARPLSDASERALIVSVDHERITMSLRESTATAVTRAIPSPADRSARLHAITWLAGNLARDQVSGILATPPNPLPTPPTEPPPAVAPEAQPPAAPRPADATLAPDGTTTAAVVATKTAPTATEPSGWTIGVAAGPAIGLFWTGFVLSQTILGHRDFAHSYSDIFSGTPTLWRVEARRRNQGSRVFTGLALEGDGTVEIAGATAFIGTTRRRGRWGFDALLGAGIDVGERFFSASTRTTTTTSELRPGLYGAAGLAVWHPLWDSVEWTASLDTHVSVIDRYDNYLALTLGLRYRL